MRLACPNCDAKYEVPDDAIPEAGRDVQCSSCGHAWFQMPPEAEIAAEEEAALYGDDLPVPEVAAAKAGPVAAPPAATDEDDGDDTPAPVPGAMPVAQALEDSVLAVLREEAERETEARRQEAQRSASRQADADVQMQTQPDLGIEAAVAATVAAAVPAAAAAVAEELSPTQRRLAMLKGEDPDAPPPAPARPPARRDLLPDVEEINSTLQPGEAGDDPEDVDALPDLTRGRSGFRTGFLLALFVLGVAAVVYLAAPSLIATVPALEGPLTAYVAFVDGLRLWLNELMTSASDRLNPGG